MNKEKEMVVFDPANFKQTTHPDLPVFKLEHHYDSHTLPAVIAWHQQPKDWNVFTDTCGFSPVNCANDMSGYTFPLSSIHKSNPLSYAKPNVNPIPNFYDVRYAGDFTDKDADDYGTDNDQMKCSGLDECSDLATALNYIAYYPTGVDYTTCKLPCIILFHAGGYSDCSNYKYEDSLCYCLARKGFIVFLVEYRRGRIKDTADGGIYTTAQQSLAMGRAFQDGRGAIRSIIKRQRNILSNNLPYQIDTNFVFVAGQSAGACIAASLAYYRNQSMIDAIFPVPTGQISLTDAIGPIDADYYFGEPDIEYQSKIKGLWCMWGGFPMPIVNGASVDEYNFLSNNGNWALVPMIGFMGKNDPVFPYKESDQYLYSPKDTPHFKYIKETSCLIDTPFKVFNTSHPLVPDLRIECTNDIYNIFIAHGIPAFEYVDCSMKHGLQHVCGTCICITDFGAPGHVLTLNQVNEYLASRACFIFQNIMNGNVGLLQEPSRFYNCRDYRHSDTTACTLLPDNAGCNNDDACSKDD